MPPRGAGVTVRPLENRQDARTLRAPAAPRAGDAQAAQAEPRSREAVARATRPAAHVRLKAAAHVTRQIRPVFEFALPAPLRTHPRARADGQIEAFS
eukprot:1173025-Pleurochrysis_carterae.AAC.1